MEGHILHFVSFVFFIFWISSGESLVCFQCGDSTAGGKCATDIEGMTADHKVYRNSSSITDDNKAYQYTYRKTCSAVQNASACIIERIEQKGETGAFIRDCTDMYSFSLDDGRLTDLPTNNDTTCIYTNNFLYCVTLCAQDFCNGPQFDNAGGRSSLSVVILILNMVFHCINLLY